jgi:glutamate-1-semialdehyde 2,1-aminomutase
VIDAGGMPADPQTAEPDAARRYSSSAQLYAEALELLPGGVNSPVRAMRAIGRDPIFVERGEGAELVDVDGNRYVDWVQSWGPLVAGHAHPDVVEAVTAAARRGTSFGAPTEAEVELARAVVERVPSAEMVRMTSSGTEAAMSALRLARAATGRDAVLKFAGAYHGHVDGLLADAGSGLATQAIPASPGVTDAQAADTVVVGWNDRDGVERALAERPPAAIVCEPYPANMGLVAPEPGFLAFLREQAGASCALLVFDEVISGFRVAPGGAQEREDVTPDLTILGKVIGGGLPAAAYAGRRDLMERVAPAGDVYQAGTLSGNPLATAAGLATLRLLDAAAYERLERTTARLAAGLRALAREAAGGEPAPAGGEPAPHAAAGAEAAQAPRLAVASTTGLLTAFFRAALPRDLDEVRECDFDAHGAFCRAMLDRGVYLPPSQYEAWFPSLAHTDEHVDRTLAAAEGALATL